MTYLGVVHYMGKSKGKKKPPKPDDKGTPEYQARRKALIGKDANPQLASYPLGVLLARKVISQDQHNAGDRYAILCAAVLEMGPRQPSLGMGEDAERRARDERAWRKCTDALLSCGWAVKQATDAACCHNMLPRDHDLVVTGLKTLHKVFYGEDRPRDVFIRAWRA